MSDSTRPQIIMTSEQAGARQLAEEMAEQSKNPLDQAKVPGGVFARADGTLQNAHGEVVNEKGKVITGTESEPDADEAAEPEPAPARTARRR